MSPRLKSRLVAVLSLAVFAFALWVLKDSLGQVRWAEVRGHLLGLPGWRLAGALLCVAGSYWMLSYYDLLAVRAVGSGLPYRQVAPISFSAYAVGHNLGFSALSGGALRLRAYSRLGLSTSQIGGIAALCAITFALGVNLVLDAALLRSVPRTLCCRTLCCCRLRCCTLRCCRLRCCMLRCWALRCCRL